MSAKVLTGRRISPAGSSQVSTPGEVKIDLAPFKPGDYMLLVVAGQPELWFRDPSGRLGRVSKHTITEHEDGTISVDPSIADDGWHGWLTRGVWRTG